jgi:hypothetical protein
MICAATHVGMCIDDPSSTASSGPTIALILRSALCSHRAINGLSLLLQTLVLYEAAVTRAAKSSLEGHAQQHNFTRPGGGLPWCNASKLKKDCRTELSLFVCGRKVRSHLSQSVVARAWCSALRCEKEKALVRGQRRVPGPDVLRKRRACAAKVWDPSASSISSVTRPPNVLPFSNAVSIACEAALEIGLRTQTDLHRNDLHLCLLLLLLPV